MALNLLAKVCFGLVGGAAAGRVDEVLSLAKRERTSSRRGAP